MFQSRIGECGVSQPLTVRPKLTYCLHLFRGTLAGRRGSGKSVIDLMHYWLKEIGAKAGADKIDVKLLTGSVSAH